ncbi:hypothetical protein [Chondromyces apiculatus]|uniref:DUF3352 domain-containing protein n=1 Tax=Chondromyces apiculatus DSM 436 TaxID=1192034 RepID=A0A017T0S8_9BACT|nr:hypothetical protein [Chondromyces apiculatus]EYF02151.1 Hypothetical protein CAP_7362 [Chondromyces apiculatus DSM 436]
MRTLLSLSFLVPLVAGCGSAPPAGDTPTTPTTVAPPAAVATAAPLDLSPVPPPADLVAQARWSNPQSTLSTLAGCAGVPPQLTETGARIAVEAILDELLPADMDPKALAAVVALDAPVFGVVALDPASKRGRPIGVVSLGLTSLEAARGAAENLGTLTEIAPGLSRIGGKERTRRTCGIAAAAGSAPARLVCGDRDADLVELSPYVTRTLPGTPAEGRDLRGELRLVPITDKFGAMARQQLRGVPILIQSQATIGEPLFDKTIMEAGNALTTEVGALIADADKITLEVGADPTSCLTVSGAIALRGSSSWLGGTIADQARVLAPPPPFFWRLPKDSETATFAHSADGSRAAPLLKTLGDLLEGYLAKENAVSAADRKALADLLRNLPVSKDASSVSASGGSPPPAAAKAGQDATQKMFEDLINTSVGWNLIGVTEKPEVLGGYFKRIVTAYGRPSIQAALKKLMKDDAKFLPTVKTVAAPKELGKGGVAIDLTFKDLPAPNPNPLDGAGPAKTKSKPLRFEVHLYIMGDGDTSWMAIGADKADLLRRLAAVKNGAPADGTLTSRAGLETIKNAKANMGGFLTIAPITRSVGSTASTVLGAMGMGGTGGPPAVQQALGVLNNLPHKGAGPIFFSTQNQGGAAPQAQFTINVTKPALEDVGALLVSGLKLAQSFKP